MGPLKQPGEFTSQTHDTPGGFSVPLGDNLQRAGSYNSAHAQGPGHSALLP